MDYLTGKRSPPSHSAAIRRQQAAANERFVFGRGGESSRHSIPIALPNREQPHAGRAQPRGGGDKRLEHWLQIECRTADHVEHVACRGLVVERFLQVMGTLAQLVGQPGIFHCGDGLGREVQQQRDLLLGKWAHCPAADPESAEQGITLAQGDPEHRSVGPPRSEATLREPSARGMRRAQGSTRRSAAKTRQPLKFGCHPGLLGCGSVALRLR